MLSLIRISQHPNYLWDQVPNAFKFWHGRQWSPIDSAQLRQIDDLWIRCSKGKSIFNAQRKIFLECDGEIIVNEAPHLHIKPVDLRKFQYKIGWARKVFADYPPCCNYQDALRGHLPRISLNNPFIPGMCHLGCEIFEHLILQ